jgi:hypothetical protein
MEIYLSSPVCLLGIVLNGLSTVTVLPCMDLRYMYVQHINCFETILSEIVGEPH